MTNEINTKARLPWNQLAPQAYKAMGGVAAALADSTLGKKLIDLVQLRVSQINGCAYCVDMHARDLLKMGEDLQRVNSLSTWHEVGLYDARERAALQWAESLTQVADTHAPDADFEQLKAHFDDREIAELSLVVSLMNAWNRMGVGMRMPVVPRALQPA
ncbi:carboxymuconolactone decarboxylase family protein [Variovorax sp. OV329]|uniref:carboxymuconolactone decarboxylase family protein n=1 Tax=Variovorax sp. OV329 TaxID=1882825 RepID=UPI0008E501FF|nr:carboxymuconolactone decarboxylase family protein [Variovorax sp. OV329]SFM32105.1 alkylhydroperoxidase AhpD family core domain-containing protein [Variovorax sp. OV329]